MKGRINLASAARKASAKGRLSRARVGARSMGREGGEREERGRRGHSTQGNPKNTTSTQTQQHRTILISRLLVCTVGEGDGGRSWAAVQ